jgi:hypothetical protein
MLQGGKTHAFRKAMVDDAPFFFLVPIVVAIFGGSFW